MASSTNPHITDELLSAYIDNAVTEDERRQVEAAVAADPGVAWRLESLRHTVHLLKHLPELAAPRSFALTLEAVAAPGPRRAPPMVAPNRRAQPVAEPVSAGFGGFWQSLFQGGNLFLRNAAAGAALVFLMLVGANFALPNLQSIELARTGVTSNAYPGPAIASTQPLATLTQIVSVANQAAAAETTPESMPVQSANGQAPLAASAAEPASEPAAQSADAPAVALQSAVVAQDSNANDAATEDTNLENAQASSEEAAPPAAAKQSALGTEANQAIAPEAAPQQRIAAQPTATPFPQATAAAEIGVGGAAVVTEMVTASSVISEQEAPLAAMSIAQADAPPPAAGQSAELDLAPAVPSTAGESAIGAASADASVADAETVEEAAPVADDEEAADMAVAEEEAVENTEAYAAADSPLAAPAAEDAAEEDAAEEDAVEEDGADSVAQAPAPASIEQPPAAEAAPAAAEEPAPIVAEAPSEVQPAVQRSLNAPVDSRVNAGSLLWYAQIIAALCTLGFTLLWWRSRE
ncbi:MAG: hypothetical protein R2911_14635 [Caldilineaceae bacterium]